MDLETRKILFVQEFLRLENEKVIISLENLLRKRQTESFEENLQPMSLARFNAEIDRALDDSENDRMIKSSDLKEKIKRWH